jgi:hypothetical protein
MCFAACGRTAASTPIDFVRLTIELPEGIAAALVRPDALVVVSDGGLMTTCDEDFVFYSATRAGKAGQLATSLRQAVGLPQVPDVRPNGDRSAVLMAVSLVFVLVGRTSEFIYFQF